MPTGYTEDVIEKDISFREFALKCMRAFGALVSFRDEDSNKVITEVPLDDHYQKAIDKAKAELASFEALSIGDTRQLSIKEIADSYTRNLGYRDKAELENKRLEAMIEKVKDWTAPTADHADYKGFMLEQLRISLNDLSYYKTEGPDLSDRALLYWVKDHAEHLRHNVTYYTEGLDKAIQRNKEANAWIKAVLESLPQEVTA